MISIKDPWYGMLLTYLGARLNFVVLYFSINVGSRSCYHGVYCEVRRVFCRVASNLYNYYMGSFKWGYK